jgi:hypothetical protein
MLSSPGDHQNAYRTPSQSSTSNVCWSVSADQNVGFVGPLRGKKQRGLGTSPKMTNERHGFRCVGLLPVVVACFSPSDRDDPCVLKRYHFMHYSLLLHCTAQADRGPSCASVNSLCRRTHVIRSSCFIQPRCTSTEERTTSWGLCETACLKSRNHQH